MKVLLKGNLIDYHEIPDHIDIEKMITLLLEIQNGLGVAGDVSEDLKELYEKNELFILKD